MTAPLRVRLMLIPLVWLPAGLLAWAYIATHDLARTWRQLQAGRHVTWPPATKSGTELDPAAHLAQLLATGGAVLWPAAVAVLVLAVAVLASRLHHRRRRARETTRWELRLGRDDLANPYRVQEAFEGIAGAIAMPLARTHLARLRPRRVRDPPPPRQLDPLHRRRAPHARSRDPRATGGPLPRRRPHPGRRPAELGRHRHATQEAPPVRAVDPDDTQLRARVHRIARRAPVRARARDDRATRAHPRARVRPPPSATPAQAPRAHAPARRPPRPRRARHRLGRRSQGAQGRARAPAPLAPVLRPARHRQRPHHRRRAAGLFSQLRSENELRPPPDASAAHASTPAGPNSRCPTRSPACERACCRHRSSRRSGSSRAARVKHARAAARDRPARDRAPRDRARRRARAAPRRARPGVARDSRPQVRARTRSADRAAARAR